MNLPAASGLGIQKSVVKPIIGHGRLILGHYEPSRHWNVASPVFILAEMEF